MTMRYVVLFVSIAVFVVTGDIRTEVLEVPTAQYSTIQRALDLAADGDEIVVSPGHYLVADTLNPNRLHDPSDPKSSPVKNVVLSSLRGPAVTVISIADPEAIMPAILLQSGESRETVIDGFTFLADRRLSFFDFGQPMPGGSLVMVEGTSAPTIVSCVIRGGESESGGGAFCGSETSPLFQRCTFRDNFGFFGGGVHCAGTARFESCVFSRNIGFEGEGGGGLLATVNSHVELVNCIISGNIALPIFGGGLFASQDATLTVTNCTIVGNCAIRGAAIFSLNGNVTVKNSIAWDNRNFEGKKAIDTKGRSPDVLFSCVQGPEAQPGRGNVEVDPRFVKSGKWSQLEEPIDDEFFQFLFGKLFGVNDGQIWEDGDYRSRADSPLIDQGASDGAPMTDFDGNLRPCGEGVDMGAFESGDCRGSTFRRGDVAADGRLTISDPVAILHVLFRTGDALDCEKSADGNDDGRVNIADALSILQFLFTSGAAPTLPGPFPDWRPRYDVGRSVVRRVTLLSMT